MYTNWQTQLIEKSYLKTNLTKVINASEIFFVFLFFSTFDRSQIKRKLGFYFSSFLEIVLSIFKQI